MGRVLATGVRVPHIEVFDDMYAARMQSIDVAQCMPNFIDNVAASALVWLASQFDLLGEKGYANASTEAEKREVIKNAIELHRYKGTPYAIELALKNIGYTTVNITEGIAGPNNPLDGSWPLDGTTQLGLLNIGNGWATFSVQALGHPSISPDVIARSINIINEFKNARSLLVEFTTI